jgi:hypothetical protein
MNILPTKEEINPFGDLDGNAVEAKLLGKSVEELVAMLEDNSIYYSELFLWMGPKAFVYYFPAALHYGASDVASKDADFVNCMLGNINFRLKHDREAINSVFPILIEFVDLVLDEYSRFDVDSNIYGNLDRDYELLRAQITEQAAPRNR